jgi:hypothetical protein
VNRRKFWTVITGGLMGTRLGWVRFPPETILEIDQHGVVTDLSLIDLGPLIESFKKFTLETEFTTKAFNQIRKDITASPVFLECEDVDDDPRHCIYCGQYPCDCWRDV